MIEVRHLTKRYGSHTAVSDLSFTIENGVIYGFLGPNGAGKSTTMNIITGCLGATEGEVLVDGHSISEEPMQAKKKIGYLPEQPPLYTDMTPMEYLRFVASAKGLSRSEQTAQIDRVMDKTGIRDVRDRLIRNLSKGYRQRVGIAQAMLNDPKILILDEPTAGLDPNERIRFRNLISELADDRLVLLSTHIVSDVEFIANEIILMNKGEFFFTGTAEDIVSSIGKEVWTCTVSRQEVDEYLKQYLVANVKTAPKGAELRILSDHPPVPDARQEQATLEDAFLFYFGEKAGEAE